MGQNGRFYLLLFFYSNQGEADQRGTGEMNTSLEFLEVFYQQSSSLHVTSSFLYFLFDLV